MVIIARAFFCCVRVVMTAASTSNAFAERRIERTHYGIAFLFPNRDRPPVSADGPSNLDAVHMPSPLPLLGRHADG